MGQCYYEKKMLRFTVFYFRIKWCDVYKNLLSVQFSLASTCT
jgi:hypothetical protein